MLRRAAIRGAVVLSTTSFGGSLLSFLALVVLARLLSPREFGKVAIAVTAAELLFVVASWSLATALVREPEASAQAAFDAALVLVFALSVGLCLVGGVISLAIWQFGEAELATIFAVVVGARVLTLFAYCFSPSLDRRLAFGRVAMLQLCMLVSGLATALGLGWAGAGVWALVGREVAGALVLTALAVALSEWRPTWRLHPKKIRELVRFGATMTLSRAADILFHRTDNLVVASFAGTTELGLYSQAYNTAETANKVYMPILAYVPLPMYARVQGDTARTSSAFGLVTFVMTRSIVPVAAILIAYPTEVVRVLFGDAWTAAAPMLGWLAFYAVVLPLFTHIRELLIANGAIGHVLAARIIQLAVFMPLVTVLVFAAGGEGAAIAVCVGIVTGTAAIAAFARRFVTFSWADYMPPALAGVGGWVAASAVSQGGRGDVATLVFGSIAALATYSLILLAIERRLLLANGRTILAAFGTPRPREAGGRA